MLTDREVLQRLWDTGHFHSPLALAISKVKESDLDRLKMDDLVVLAAGISYQEFMRIDLEPFAFRFHRRMLVADGVIGPATREQMLMPRCAVPDYADPEQAVGNGSWPEPCQKGGVKVHFDTSSMPAALKPRWDKIKADVLAIYADVGLRIVEVQQKAGANITMWWAFLAGSTIGIAEFNSESCSDVVTCRLDTGYTGYVASLLAHEMGHNCNLQHRSQGGIMHPSIRPDPVPFTWRNDPSFPDLVRYFGGQPIDPAPTPTPTPVPVDAPAISGAVFGEQVGSVFAIRGEMGLTVTPQTKPGSYNYIIVPGAATGQYKPVPKPSI